MMYTTFFVYTYVIHCISLLHDCYFPFIFIFFFWVYTNGIHSLSAFQLLGISLEYDILAHGWLDIGGVNKYTLGISYILMESPTHEYHVNGTQRYIRLTVLYYCMIAP